MADTTEEILIRIEYLLECLVSKDGHSLKKMAKDGKTDLKDKIEVES